MSEPISQLQRFRDAALRWRDRLWLNHLNIDFRAMTADEADPGPEQRFATVATSHPNPHYRMGMISVNEGEVGASTDEKVSHDACHEMVHFVLAPLVECQERLIERLPVAEHEIAELWFGRAVESVTSHLTDVLATGPEWSEFDHRAAVIDKAVAEKTTQPGNGALAVQGRE